ncbi:uncharacterized protein [Rutidosis leptorrhynchoides]|uniref:uncharacterized protein n=1 Tax=Rutidosis leptorrhynchoides TaxID=125765 RepID=UPI003A99843B
MTSALLNAVINEEKGVSDVSSTVNDSVVNSKNPEASQTLNAAGMKEKGVDKDPVVVNSSSKKKKKKKNKSARRKNRSEKLLKKTDDSGGSSSQNSGNYPKFELDGYPLAREEDRDMMKMMNEYNRRNHAIIAEQGFEGVSDRQIGNLWEIVRSIGQMVGADSVRISTTQDNNIS